MVNDVFTWKIQSFIQWYNCLQAASKSLKTKDRIYSKTPTCFCQSTPIIYSQYPVWVQFCLYTVVICICYIFFHSRARRTITVFAFFSLLLKMSESFWYRSTHPTSNYNRIVLCVITILQPFPKRQILDCSKLKEFADNNFKFDENGRKFFKRVENTVLLTSNFSFSQSVFKTFVLQTHKNKGLFGRGLNPLLKALSPGIRTL